MAVCGAAYTCDERGEKKDEAVITYDDPHAAQSGAEVLRRVRVEREASSTVEPSRKVSRNLRHHRRRVVVVVRRRWRLRRRRLRRRRRHEGTAAVDARTGVTDATIEADIATIEVGYSLAAVLTFSEF